MPTLSLMIAGSLSLVVALGHLAFAFVSGPAGYRYFGEGELARLSEAGSPVPPLLTLGAAVLFGLAGLYGIAGAGAIRALPYQRMALLVVSAVYVTRGLLVIPQAIALWSAPGSVFPRQIVFSIVSLAIGAFYVIGTIGRWRSLA